MTTYIGQSLLLSVLIIGIIPFIGRWSLTSTARFHLSQTAVLLISFIWLMIAHLRSDFSLLNVVMNSHTEKPWLYKVAGVWGNHEGSMLLWMLLQAGWGLAAAFWLKDLTATQQQRLHLLAIVLTSAFTLFIIFACDPFTAMAMIPEQGRDLNPLLQDPLLAIHPPFLYMGYVGTSVPFLCLLALNHQGLTDLVGMLLNYIRLTWTFLTLGLALGSFWAYYELGWGGWWFWDPVENAALVPWLLVTALLHLIKLPPAILVSHERPLRWLIVATYASCLFGTYLVRSGALSSVHSFAVDAERSVMLLILCVLVLLPGIIAGMGGITSSAKNNISLPWQLLLAGVALLGFVACVIAFSTVYPLVLAALGMPLSVGPSFYQKTVVPMLLPILLLMAVMPWFKPGQKKRHFLSTAIILAALTMVGLYWFDYLHSWLQGAALAIAFVVLFSTILLSKQIKSTPTNQRMLIAHGAVAVAVLGMALSTALQEEKLVALTPGESLDFAGKRLNFDQVTEIPGPNYQAQQATLTLEGGTILHPQKRFYWTQGIIHGETAIHSTMLDHYYVALGDQYQNGQWSLRLYYKPYINLLWLGALVLVIAGLWRFPMRKSLRGLMLMMLITPTLALEPHEQLSNRDLEQRAKLLGDDLLCPSCAGQPLNDSVGDEAVELRKKVREFVVAGKTDQEITTWFTDHFGEQVLREPPWSMKTYWLWGLPWLGFLLMIFLIFRKLAPFKKRL